jgi:GTP-binding protein YchF
VIKVKISIIGLPNSGKSTIFNTLTQSNIETGTFCSTKTAPNISVVKVPDDRVEKLTAIFNPKKKTPAEITFQDFVGIVKDGTKKKDSMFSEEVKQSDALVHVCRVFKEDTVPHPDGSVDGLRDAEIFELELIMADLALIDNKLERLKKEFSRKKTQELVFEHDLMERLKATLEAEQPIRSVDLTEEEKKVIKGYCFLSQKPMILLANIDEEQLHDPPVNEIEEFAHKIGIEFMAFCGKIEMEISQMDDSEQAEFLAEYGILEPARNVFIQRAYDMLGLISFFTVGEDEVKAWTITRGTDAVNAAGVIHSDLQRGFIRAETVSYDDFMSAGSLPKAREKGLLRQEGKTYIVKDGDIINIKFNV